MCVERFVCEEVGNSGRNTSLIGDVMNGIFWYAMGGSSYTDEVQSFHNRNYTWELLAWLGLAGLVDAFEAARRDQASD